MTQMIYVAARGRLAAVDLTTDKKVWENAYDGQCCERPQISPDGSFMYVGSDLKDFWYVVNPKTGELITKALAPLSPNAHNLNLSPDGKFAFMSPNGKIMSIADTSTHKTVKTIPFNDNIRVFVLNHDASLIYTNQNNFLGFQIADVKTGKVLHTRRSPGLPLARAVERDSAPENPARLPEPRHCVDQRREGSLARRRDERLHPHFRQHRDAAEADCRASKRLPGPIGSRSAWMGTWPMSRRATSST